MGAISGTDKYLKTHIWDCKRAICGTDKYLKTPIWGYIGLYLGQTRISKLLYCAVQGYIWDRQVFKNSYMGLCRAISGTDKDLKTPIWGCIWLYLGQTSF